MTTSTPISRQYAKAVFIDHTRTFNSVPATQKEPVREWAGTSTLYPQYAPTIYLENINDSLAAETITQAQYDQLLTDYPDIPSRPFPMVAATTETK